MTDSPATRQSLLVRLKDPRDGQAWSEFVAIYSPLIDRLARANGLQSADAADIAQEVFRAVAGAIDRYDPDPARGSFRGWLFRIARNLMINLLAARRIRPQATGDSDVQEMLERVPAPDSAETAFFDLEYRRRIFVWAADQIRDEFRESTWQAFWLTAVEGQTPRAAAEASGISVGAVYIAKSRVMARLKSIIEQVEGKSELLAGGHTGRNHMTSRPNDCDLKRLRLSLDDRLTEAEQADLAEHLEQCADCCGRLEQMAAASGYWGDAALLRGEATTGGPFTVGGVGQGPHDHECEDDFDDLGAGLREFLEPPDPAHPETIGRMGPYEILEVLGRGGMGVVLKARDPGLDRIVAIKVLTPALAHGGNARRRFAREARAVAAVGHEHIVAVYAVDEFRGLPYLVMQYIPGRSLQERLDASGPLEVREILRIGTQAARALAAAHAQGVVHRDIKPANILLENCVERVKLTDFGLARAIDDASLTQSGVIAGTPQYMAPEQARGEPVDARADLFALGAALYAMAAGRSPFRADSAMAVMKRVCDAAHRPIREINPDVPAWLEAVIDRLLAKAPDDRFQTATEVADLLEKGLAHIQQPTSVPPPWVSAGEANGVEEQ